MRDFLPAEAVEEGGSWEVDAKAFALVVRPGGDLHWTSGEGDDPGLELGGQFAENLSGTVTATFTGEREVEGAKLGVVRIEADVETHGQEGEDGQVVKLAFELEGEMLWLLAENRLASCSLTGALEVVIEQNREVDQGGQQFRIEQSTKLAGKANFSIGVDD